MDLEAVARQIQDAAFQSGYIAGLDGPGRVRVSGWTGAPDAVTRTAVTIVPSELGASEWQYHYEREDGSKQLPFRAGTGIVAEAVGGLLPMMRRLPYNHAEHMVAVAQMIHSQGWGQAGRHSSR